jgi:hypothetical protein
MGLPLPEVSLKRRHFPVGIIPAVDAAFHIGKINTFADRQRVLPVLTVSCQV